MTSVAEPFARLGRRQRSRRRFEQNRAFVVRPHGAENACVREFLGRGRMDVELLGDLCWRSLKNAQM